MISLSSSLTHVVVDKGAAPWDQGWWKVVWGLQPLPSPGPWMLLTSPAFASSCPHPAQFAQTLPPSFATAFIYKSFQCCVRGNFRVGKRKSTELGEL